jgi:hypothetical protein
MATTVATFYHSTTAQDYTAPGSVNIRKLVESAPGSNATTICSHANAAGTTQITLSPYTTSSTASDIRANDGWSVNRLGADGMVATASAYRVLLPGVWTFIIAVAIPAAGTLTGTLTVSVLITVYKVDSSGNRSALFSATSNTVASATGAGANSGTLTATSTSQPQYILQANETIHVGYLSNMVQVAGTLGATVAGTATYTVGTTSQSIVVPSSGVRTQNNSTLSVTSAGTPSYTKQIAKTLTVASSSVASYVKALSKSPFTVSNSTTPTYTKQIGLPRSTTATGTAIIIKQVGKLLVTTGTGVASYIKRVAKTLTATATGSPVMTRLITAARTLSVTSTVIAAFSRAITAARTLPTTATGSPTMTKLISAFRTFAITTTGTPIVIKQVLKRFVVAATGTPTMTRIITAIKLFTVTATGTPLMQRSIIAARSFISPVTVTIQIFMNLSITIINRLTGGATIVIKKLVAMMDD